MHSGRGREDEDQASESVVVPNCDDSIGGALRVYFWIARGARLGVCWLGSGGLVERAVDYIGARVSGRREGDWGVCGALAEGEEGLRG